jgi:hypothetical protein
MRVALLTNRPQNVITPEMHYRYPQNWGESVEKRVPVRSFAALPSWWQTASS